MIGELPFEAGREEGATDLVQDFFDRTITRAALHLFADGVRRFADQHGTSPSAVAVNGAALGDGTYAFSVSHDSNTAPLGVVTRDVLERAIDDVIERPKER